MLIVNLAGSCDSRYSGTACKNAHCPPAIVAVVRRRGVSVTVLGLPPQTQSIGNVGVASAMNSGSVVSSATRSSVTLLCRSAHGETIVR